MSGRSWDLYHRRGHPVVAVNNSYQKWSHANRWCRCERSTLDPKWAFPIAWLMQNHPKPIFVFGVFCPICLRLADNCNCLQFLTCLFSKAYESQPTDARFLVWNYLDCVLYNVEKRWRIWGSRKTGWPCKDLIPVGLVDPKNFRAPRWDSESQHFDWTPWCSTAWNLGWLINTQKSIVVSGQLK